LGIALATACALAGAAPSSTGAGAAATLPEAIWAVQLGAASPQTFTRAAAGSLRDAGVNVVVLDAAIDRAGATRVRALAGAAGLRVVTPLRSRQRCLPPGPTTLCSVRAGSPTAALRLARAKGVDLVIVPLRSAAQLGRLRGRHGSRILAVAPLAAPGFDRDHWQTMVAIARSGPRLDLGIVPTTAAMSTSLSSYLSVLRTALRSRDTRAPSVPQGMAFTVLTKTSVGLRWNAARDDVGVAGYRLFRNGVAVATVSTLRHAYARLACATTYTFALEAYDVAGNTSNRAEATGKTATRACGGAGRPPTTPRPPSVPQPRRPPFPLPPALPPVGTSANLWVDATGGSCSRDGVSTAYVDGRACSTLNAAYQAAANGDTILIRGGSYGRQVVAQKTLAAAPGIRFATVRGETVAFSTLEIKGSFVRISGPFRTQRLEVDGAGNSAPNAPVEDVLVDTFEVDGQNVDGEVVGYLRGAERVTWRNGRIHHNKNMSLVLADQEPSAGGLANIAFDRMTFHDALLDAGSSAHTECLYAQGINNLRITNSHFYRCAVMDVFITRRPGTNTDAAGGYVENSIFEAPLAAGNVCCAANAFHFRNGGEPAPDIDNWDFRYNLFAGTLSLGGNENAVRGGGLRVIGNTFLGSSSCKGGGTVYAYNLHSDGSTCGGPGEATSSAAVIRSGFANYAGSVASNNDWHLKPGSVLLDRGSPSSYPGADRDGTPRFSGRAPDAGPYELR
jgi:hypothetical protein